VHHAFWKDEVSVLDRHLIHAEHVHGPRQLTDLYLLALAVHYQGRFVSFDGGIAVGAVRAARPEHLVVL